MPDSFESIQQKIAQARQDLISVDLELCLTLANVAETAIHMGHMERAGRTLSKAEKGFADMLRYFSRSTGLTEEATLKFQSRFDLLRHRLDNLRHALLPTNRDL